LDLIIAELWYILVGMGGLIPADRVKHGFLDLQTGFPAKLEMGLMGI
jgi:hypothetical protein